MEAPIPPLIEEGKRGFYATGCRKPVYFLKYLLMRRIPQILFFLILIVFFSHTACAEEPDDFARLREQMVQQQIVARGVRDTRVIQAMLKVPRHFFVPEARRAYSYGDYPLPIGEGQTISQPYIVAYMTEALELRAEDRILEIGTGSGYQAAVLGELVKEVYTIEIIGKLGKRARQTLDRLKYRNIHVKIGDGYKGWPEKAPFDAVIVTCAPEKIPPALIRQLNEGGRMIIPVGSTGSVQKLVRLVKKGGRIKAENVMYVRFVPMVKGND
jgi:protein-L-isoaspartate(D-aspartate) O-methyltransferase